jgi:hypothetical protein
MEVPERGSPETTMTGWLASAFWMDLEKNLFTVLQAFFIVCHPEQSEGLAFGSE